MVIGFIIGWLAGVIGRGSGYGLTGDIVIAEVGALAGGFLVAGLLNLPDPLIGFNLVTILAAFLGSIINITFLERLGAGKKISL
jgi:uncharacterized membrane protein YeaQ/YmgE (transglycosylase-associated protein family)